MADRRRALPTLSALVLAGFALAPAGACGNFSESGAGSDDAGGPVTGDAAVDGSGGPADAARDVVVGTGDGSAASCIDLRQGPGPFTSDAPGSAMATSDTTGLKIAYPTGGSYAAWMVEIPASGKTGVHITLTTKITLPSPLPTSSWYADVVALLNGPITDADHGAIIAIALAKLDATSATVDLDLFPDGTTTDTSPTTTARFTTAKAGKQDMVIDLDATWSSESGANSVAAVGGETGKALHGRTSALPPAETWTLFLGTSADAAAPVAITYEQVCVTLR